MYIPNPSCFVKKIIGTEVPVFSLKSNAHCSKNSGTFADGLIFLDWLKATGQSGWQMLPLSQPHLIPGSKKLHASSPYRGYGVGLDPRFLSEAYRNYVVSESEKKIFTEENRAWIDDYAFFCALRDYFWTDDWTQWPVRIRVRSDKAMAAWRQKLTLRYEYHVVEQCRLHKDFFEMKKKAHKLGISIIGDMPYYLPLQSPLVWANQKSFDISASGKMRKVSGVPDSSKAHFGRQVWGHPLYSWNARSRRSEIINLWKIRLNYLNQLYDMVRLDHAKGFYYYGAMDPTDSKKDSFRKGPGYYALSRVIKHAGRIGLEVFAEDAGDRLKELRAGLKKLNVPGIRMMRFAYNEKRKLFEDEYASVMFYPANTYAYTTTHDTETLVGYIASLTTTEKRGLCEKIGVVFSASKKILAERLRDAILSSRARVVIIPIQDWLLISSRINIPGTEKMEGDKNWRFRLPTPIENLPISTIKEHIDTSTRS